MSSSHMKMLVASVGLVILGAVAMVTFRAYVWDEMFWPLLLAAAGIGTILGMVADHRTRRGVNVAIAAVAAWMCGLASLSAIAMLERQATATEFDLRSLSDPEFFIALEAYGISESKQSTGRAFTSATGRNSYDEETWRTASGLWNARPEAEKQAIRQEWERDYRRLNRSTASVLAEVCFAPDYLLIYAICSIVASAIMVASAHGEPS